VVIGASAQSSDLETQLHVSSDCAALVSRVRSGDTAAVEELYNLFGRSVRYFLLRHLSPDEIDDQFHDCFIAVLQAIHDGQLREPERLMGYVRTVVKRKIATSISSTARQRRTRVQLDHALPLLCDLREDPERGMVSRQQMEIARRVLKGVGQRDREILQRFYVLEQTHEQIRADMGLSYTQFRLLKSRAKARFGKFGKQLAGSASRAGLPQGKSGAGRVHDDAELAHSRHFRNIPDNSRTQGLGLRG
jgi:RNA polymerase sigma factor (sigma-70 family)